MPPRPRSSARGSPAPRAAFTATWTSDELRAESDPLAGPALLARACTFSHASRTLFHPNKAGERRDARRGFRHWRASMTILKSGSGRCALTDKDDEGVQVRLDNGSVIFLCWKALRQQVQMMTKALPDEPQ